MKKMVGSTYIQHSARFIKTYFKNQFPYLWTETENRETFFWRVEQHFGRLSPEYKMIEKAYETAKYAFRNTHRETGERYFEHCRAVALILMMHLRVSNVNVICAALLHDVLEDCEDQGWTLDRMRAEFNDEVARIVEEVTKPPKSLGGTREQRNEILYKRQRNISHFGAMVKLSDRLHNLFTLWDPIPEEKRLRKVDETSNHYLAMASEHSCLYWELRWMVELHKVVPDFKGWRLVYQDSSKNRASKRAKAKMA